MIQRFLVWFIQHGPKTKRWFWRVWYNVFARKAANHDFQFMNYGYAEKDFFPTLDPEDENERWSAQLYHHIASQENISDKKVLEVGSGRGGGASYLYKYLKPKTVVGIDISKEAVSLCNARYKTEGLSFVVGDSENIPFDENTFEAVINVESSHCYGNISKFLSEVCRVLRPGGFFLWADFRTCSEMEKLFSFFSTSELTLTREKDITKNVIIALNELTKTRKEKIETHVPKIFQSVFMSYAGIKGSDVYRSFVERKFIYKSATLVKKGAIKNG